MWASHDGAAAKVMRQQRALRALAVEPPARRGAVVFSTAAGRRSLPLGVLSRRCGPSLPNLRPLFTSGSLTAAAEMIWDGN